MIGYLICLIFSRKVVEKLRVSQRRTVAVQRNRYYKYTSNIKISNLLN